MLKMARRTFEERFPQSEPELNDSWIQAEIVEGEKAIQTQQAALDFIRNENPELADRLLQEPFTVISPPEGSNHWLKSGVILFGISEINSLDSKRNTSTGEVHILFKTRPKEYFNAIFHSLSIPDEIGIYINEDGKLFNSFLSTRISTKYFAGNRPAPYATAFISPEITPQTKAPANINNSLLLHFSAPLREQLQIEGLVSSGPSDIIVVQQIETK